VDSYCVGQSIDFLNQAAKWPKPFVLFHATQLPHMDNHKSWPTPAEYRQQYDQTKLPLSKSWPGDLTGKPSYLTNVYNRTQADEYGYQREENIRAHIRDYYAAITQMDEFLGRLFAAMDRLKLWENTWLVFASDNGWLLGEHRMTSKMLAYEPSIRVPLFIAGPRLKPRVEQRIALNIDLGPTLLDLAGVPVPAKMQGRSLAPLLRQQEVSWRDSFVYECLDSYGGTRPTLAACTVQSKLIQTWKDQASVKTNAADFVEFYQLTDDPDEMHNSAPNPSDIQRRLNLEIKRHLESLP
jgi:arylsulfatase A-like enzyme